MDESKHANKHKNSTTDSVCDTPIKKQKHLHKAKISVLTSSQNKHKLDNADSLSLSSPFKRLKIDKEPQIESSSSRETRSKSSETLEKAIIFTKSVEEVLIRKIFDIGHRLNMTQLPECCLDPNKCRIDHETNDKSIGMSSSNQETFRINIQADLLTEALHVCENILRSNKYPNVETLQNIIKIILNAHESKFKSYSLSIILQNCQRIFKLFLSTHPSCSRHLKNVYSKFLNTPSKWNDPFKYNNDNDNESKLLNYLLAQLQYELSIGSPNGPILNKDNINVQDEEVSMEQGHLIKDKFEIYKNLHRKDRIKRLFIVLELVVDLLERDFSIWLSKCPLNPNRRITGKHKPIIALIVWQEQISTVGLINKTCKLIFQLYVDLIKLEFPSQNIDIFSRLLNLLSNTVYCCDDNPNYVYSNIGDFCDTFVEGMFDVIKCEDIKIVFEVINKLKTKYMQHLLSSMTLNVILGSKEDFIDLARSIFRENKWNQYSNCELVCPPRNPIGSHDFDLKNIYSKLSTNIKTKRRSKSQQFNHLNSNRQESVDLSNQDINALTFTLLFYYSLKYFIEFHDIESIQIVVKKKLGKSFTDHYEKFEKSTIIIDNVSFDLKEDENRLDLNKNLESYKNTMKLTEDGARFYKNIFQNVSDIVTACRNTESGNPNIYKIFCNINSIRLF